jgi:hypothetical protein
MGKTPGPTKTSRSMESVSHSGEMGGWECRDWSFWFGGLLDLVDDHHVCSLCVLPGRNDGLFLQASEFGKCVRLLCLGLAWL